MSTDVGFHCSCCDRRHHELPLAYGSPAPAYWHDGLAERQDSVLGGEQCVIEGEHFFVRGRLILPVIDSGDEFEWGVWVSLSQVSFAGWKRCGPIRTGCGNRPISGGWRPACPATNRAR